MGGLTADEARERQQLAEPPPKVFTYGTRTVRARPGCLGALSDFHSESGLPGALVWVRIALTSSFGRFLARAVPQAHVYTPVERAKLGELREDLAGLLTDEAPAGGAATGETPELWRRHRR